MRLTVGYGLEMSEDDIMELFPAEVKKKKKECDGNFSEDELHEILEKYVKNTNYGLKTDLLDSEYTVNSKKTNCHYVVYFPLHEAQGKYHGKIGLCRNLPKEFMYKVFKFTRQYPIFEKFQWQLLFMADAQR